MMNNRRIYSLELIALFYAFSFYISAGGLEAYYPSSSSERAFLSNSVFIFRASGECTLKVVEPAPYSSENDIYSMVPVFQQRVSGLTFLNTDFTFSDNTLYAWYISGYDTAGGMKSYSKSEVKYFKISDMGLKSPLDYRTHLIKKIFAESQEYANAVNSGYVFTGSVKINGVNSSDNELLSVLNRIRSSKRNAKRVKIK